MESYTTCWPSVFFHMAVFGTALWFYLRVGGESHAKETSKQLRTLLENAALNDTSVCFQDEVPHLHLTYKSQKMQQMMERSVTCFLSEELSVGHK